MRLSASHQVPFSPLYDVDQEDQDFSVEQLTQLCYGLVQQYPGNLHTVLNSLTLIAPLLNAIPNVVFFIKDTQARYLLVNVTLAQRCGFKTVAPLLGKTSADVFPSQLGSGYTEQDLRVLRSGIQIQDQLEMHLYRGRERGWCLTQNWRCMIDMARLLVWPVFLTTFRMPKAIIPLINVWLRLICIFANTTTGKSYWMS